MTFNPTEWLVLACAMCDSSGDIGGGNACPFCCGTGKVYKRKKKELPETIDLDNIPNRAVYVRQAVSNKGHRETWLESRYANECPYCGMDIEDQIVDWWCELILTNLGGPEDYNGQCHDMVCPKCKNLLEIEAEVSVEFRPRLYLEPSE